MTYASPLWTGPDSLVSQALADPAIRIQTTAKKGILSKGQISMNEFAELTGLVWSIEILVSKHTNIHALAV